MFGHFFNQKLTSVSDDLMRKKFGLKSQNILTNKRVQEFFGLDDVYVEALVYHFNYIHL